MKARYLFVAAIACGVLAIAGLRINSETALDLKTQVIERDRAGQPATEQLEELRQYVFSHMNTTTRVELVGSYERAVEAAARSQNGDVYTQAQATCDQPGVSSVAQAECVQAYLATNPGAGSEAADSVDKTRFVYAFAAPTWSPDLAGFSLLMSIVLALAALVLYIVRLFRNRPEPTL